MEQKVIRLLVKLGLYKLAYRINGSCTLNEIKNEMERMLNISRRLCKYSDDGG